MLKSRKQRQEKRSKGRNFRQKVFTFLLLYGILYLVKIGLVEDFPGPHIYFIFQWRSS